MDALKFMLAGNATFTLQSKKTGKRFTYKLQAPTKETDRGGKVKDIEANVRFLKVLTGSDNESDYTFAGTLFIKPRCGFKPSPKSRLSSKAPSVQAFIWALPRLAQGGHPDLEFYHEGACARCGRKLTDPESIKSGFGPECINKI